MEEVSADNLKSDAVKAALDYVRTKYLSSSQRIYMGAGSGTTVKKAFSYLAEYKNMVAVPTSSETESLLFDLEIETREIEMVDEIDFDLDGADEVEPSLALIKGGGGCHTWEKRVAKKSKELIIVVDQTKLVDYLGQSFPVPVEVKEAKADKVMEKLEEIGPGKIRKVNKKKFTTDQGNIIIDVKLQRSYQGVELVELERKINRIDGVIDNGIFAERQADIVFVGTEKGVKILR